MKCTCVYNNKNEWGPILWNVLHNVLILLKSVNDVNKVVTFIEGFHNVLPCYQCQMHCKNYLEQNKIILTNRTDLMKTKNELMLYMYKFHNYVNEKNNKTRHVNFQLFLTTPLPVINYINLNKIFQNQQNINFYNGLSPTAKNYNNNFISTIKSL